MRAMLALTTLATLAAGAAHAGDWEVARSEAACEVGATLTAGGAAPAQMIVRSDGEQTALRLDAPAGAELARLEVDGRPVPLEARRVGDAVEAPLTEAVSEVLAKGMRVRAVWSRGGRVSGSLVGSAKALTALRECGEQLRVARLERQTPAEPQIVDAASVTTATEADSIRSAALAEARRRYQRDVLATIGASVLGGGSGAPEPRTYEFPGTDPVVCTASLESFDCQ